MTAILAIDIGNSHTQIGLFKDGKLSHSWRIRTDTKLTEDEIRFLFYEMLLDAEVKKSEIRGCILASVVPPLTHTISKSVYSLTGKRVIVVEPGLKTGIVILMDNPKEVGADRIVNAVAASTKYPGGSIVVDLGTATTFDCISPKKEYLGGAIAPGISISSEALFLKTAKLPRVEISKPLKCIGKNTVDSMQSGIFWGYVALVDGMIEKLKEELDFKPKVIATGGFSSLIASESKSIEIVDNFLTLEGLYVLYEKNAEPLIQRQK